MPNAQGEANQGSTAAAASTARQRADDNANVRELRLGLVCYGGVSLAVYMHGITKELQKLVVASRACERDHEHNPFPERTVERAYWEALRSAWESSAENERDRVVTRVVIDVVAGTSAGGINGVILCKALAHNRSQDALRDLWFDRADFKQLLGSSWPRRWIKILGFAPKLVRNRAQPPLDGKAMLGWLRAALGAMDASPAPWRPEGDEAPSSLMPAGHPLQLFVTTTDYYGYHNSMLIEDPATVGERRNRHLLKFRYEGAAHGTVVVDHFDEHYNGALAFAARSTSSFPGAFPPVTVKMVEEHVGSLERFKAEFFAAYGLADADPEKTYFVDGGVLNNYPFQPAIDAIVKARAEAEVDRYLLYLQPDPGTPVQNPDGTPPTLFGAIWAGLSKIAAAQPIYDQLLAVRTFNEQVRMVDELTAAVRPVIASQLARLGIAPSAPLVPQSAAVLAQRRDHLDQQVEAQAGFLYPAYLEVRVESVVAQLATVVAALCGYTEPNSTFAYFIRLFLHGWACDRGLLGRASKVAAVKTFLGDLDLGYTRRRLAYVNAGVNEAYAKRATSRVERIALNRAKAALFDRIADLDAMIEGRQGLGELAERLRALFPRSLLADAAARPESELVAAFVARYGDGMDDLRRLAGKVFRDQKDALHHALYEDFRTITADWKPQDREEVVLRYLGFPFWDAMVYPINHLSQAGELRELKVMRMSPLDSTLLGAKQLMGVQLGHFGAFKSRDRREHDYLWGRLDAAERLIGLVLKDRRSKASTIAGPCYRAEPWAVKPAFLAILEEESRALRDLSPEQMADVRGRVAKLPDRAAAEG